MMGCAPCNGLCSRDARPGGGRVYYERGEKFCKRCSAVWADYAGLRCPCCGQQLRLRAHGRTRPSRGAGGHGGK